MTTVFHRLATTDPKYENAGHWGQPDVFMAMTLAAAGGSELRTRPEVA